MFLWSNWQFGSIGSDNGLVPYRRQAIAWTNVVMIYWRIYAPIGLKKMIHYLIYRGAYLLTSYSYIPSH